MPRRRLEPPPPAVDRTAAILGISSAASRGVGPPPVPGWVPQRSLLARPAAEVPEAAVPDAIVPEGVVPEEVVPEAVRPPPAVREKGLHRRPHPPGPAILTVPMALRGARAKPRGLAVLGVLVLVLAVAVVLGIRVAWARSTSKPAPIAAVAQGPPSGLVARTVPAAFASTGPTALPTTAAVLLVHVVGQVRRPGVVGLPAGSRALDAVNKAGGAKSSADLNALNLARLVADGEQIVVPKRGEAVALPGASGTAGAGTGAAGPGSAGAGTAGALVDLNTADAAALDLLPGVGPVLSQRILDWRTEHGRFSSVDELQEVSGIGDKLLAQIGPKVKV